VEKGLKEEMVATEFDMAKSSDSASDYRDWLIICSDYQPLHGSNQLVPIPGTEVT
jgi:hypothetical protein